MIERLESILKLTVDEYEKYIDTVYPYTQQELEILMRIANAYTIMSKIVSLFGSGASDGNKRAKDKLHIFGRNTNFSRKVDNVNRFIFSELLISSFVFTSICFTTDFHVSSLATLK